jgi:glycosyltransferase involved in cell wall biosynthesis
MATRARSAIPQLRLLFVGAFPPRGRQVFGGNVTACRILLKSSFSNRLELDLLDSTQISNPPPSLGVRFLGAVRRSIAFVGRVERDRYHVVLLFVSAGASVAEKGAMAWYARLRGVPAVLFPRGGALIDACRRSRLQRIWTRFAFGGAAVIFCQGERWQKFAVETLGRSPASAPVIPNWTATPDLLTLGHRRRKREADRPPRLLYLGWLEKAKGIGELLEACRLLAPYHAFHLTIAGEGHYSDTARETVRSNGLSERVVFAGWLDESAVRHYLASHDILVLPSWFEGLPNAMIEAMAAGLAVVTTPVGSIPDYVTHEEHALLVEPRDSRALAGALARLIADPQLRNHIAETGREMASRRFSVGNAVDLMIDQFRALARERQHGKRSRQGSS